MLFARCLRCPGVRRAPSGRLEALVHCPLSQFPPVCPKTGLGFPSCVALLASVRHAPIPEPLPPTRASSLAPEAVQPPPASPHSQPGRPTVTQHPPCTRVSSSPHFPPPPPAQAILEVSHIVSLHTQGPHHTCLSWPCSPTLSRQVNADLRASRTFAQAAPTAGCTLPSPPQISLVYSLPLPSGPGLNSASSKEPSWTWL